MQEVHVELYREHLEEASFLYQQRRHLLGDPELSWAALHDFEERLEAHIDALVVGADLALSVCRARLADGDAGELFAAACVFCRRAQAPLLADALKTLEPGDAERATALQDALKRELPSDWHANCLDALEHGRSLLGPVLATVLGHRRVPSGGALSRSLQNGADANRLPAVWALGRTREPGAAAAIRANLTPRECREQSVAVEALLRLNDVETLRELRSGAGWSAGQLRGVALCGGREVTAALLPELRSPSPMRNVIEALGMLGDPAAVRPLLTCLSVEAVAECAAEALHVITGAGLMEEAFVEEPPEEDELLDDELLAYRATGQLPLRADGRVEGVTIRRLSQDPAAWEMWLQANAQRFQAHRRFRVGKPMSPSVLLECLTSTVYPKALRGPAIDELLVRYRLDLQLETDMSVAQQRSILQPAAQYLDAASARFEPGRWYVGGGLCEYS